MDFDSVVPSFPGDSFTFTTGKVRFSFSQVTICVVHTIVRFAVELDLKISGVFMN